MNQQERVEQVITSKDKVTSWIKRNMATAVLVIAAMLFVFKEAMDFQRTQKDIMTILASIGLTYFFAVYVSLAMRHMGKKAGKDSQPFKAAKKYMGDAKDNIKEKTYLLPIFCRIKNDDALLTVRENYIVENGLNIKLYRAGYYKDNYDQLSDDEKQIVNHVSKLRVDMLTASQILSENSKKNNHNPNYTGRDEQELDKSATIRIMATKLLFPIIVSYFSVTVILGSNLIWGLIQTSIIMLMGVMNYMGGEEEVLTLLRNRYIQKGDWMIEFANLLRDKPRLFDDYDSKINELVAELSVEAPKNIVNNTVCTV